MRPRTRGELRGPLVLLAILVFLLAVTLLPRGGTVGLGPIALLALTVSLVWLSLPRPGSPS